MLLNMNMCDQDSIFHVQWEAENCNYTAAKQL